MAKEKKSTINVQGTAITILRQKEDDFISLTDMANKFGGDDLIYNWMRNRNTVEFLGIWEQIHNPDFKGVEFDTFKNEFKMYLIKEFQRLKEDENQRLSLAWNLNRTLAKINYRIHTDAIKENIIPPNITKEQEQHIYATEADVLNVAMFGKTALQWRKENPKREGNIRDYSSIEQLLVLANMESMNAEFVRMNLPQGERLKKLNTIAIAQLKSLTANPHIKKLDDGK